MQERVSDAKQLDERLTFGWLRTEAPYSDSNPAPSTRRHDLTWRPADFNPQGVPLTREGAAEVRWNACFCFLIHYFLS